jgi:hypothetical protein
LRDPALRCGELGNSVQDILPETIREADFTEKLRSANIKQNVEQVSARPMKASN